MDDVLDEHRALFERRTILPTDYADYGGKIERWKGDGPHGDCSCGCRWARWLAGGLGGDWCVCARPDGPRFGLLTFEHQAGHGCFEMKRRKKKGSGGHG
jgi:hypothetical protein